MKKLRRIAAALLCAALLVSLCACIPESPPVPANDGGQTNVTQPTQPPVPYSEPSTRICEDAANTGFENVITYGSDGYEKNLIWWDCEVKGVRLIGITLNEDMSFSADGNTLLSVGTLAPGSAILLDVDIPEGCPNMAVLCTYDGVERCYSIGYNGNVGGASLIETTLAPAGQLAEGELPDDQLEPQPTGFDVTLYYIDANCEHLESRETVVESSSAWHIWAALKTENTGIPMNCGLNSFNIDENDVGHLDVAAEITAAQLGSGGEALMLASIANTYIKAFDLDSLAITVNGGVYESGHNTLDAPLTFAE